MTSGNILASSFKTAKSRFNKSVMKKTHLMMTPAKVEQIPLQYCGLKEFTASYFYVLTL